MTALADSLARRAALDSASAKLTVDDDCRELCRQLRRRREALRLTMTQVAAHAGTSREMIRCWEAGGNPTLRHLMAWARALDLTVRLWDEA